MSNEQETAFATLPETHIERMDRLQFEAEQQLKLQQIQSDRDKAIAKERRKEARQDTLKIVGCSLVAALVVLGIVAAIYFGSTGTPGGPSNAEVNQQREQACLAAGGGYVPSDLLYGSESGLCVFPGRSVEVPSE